MADLVQEAWTWALSTWVAQENPQLFFSIGLFIAHAVGCYPYSLFLLLCYKFNWFPELRTDLANRGGVKEPTPEMVWKTWKESLINDFIVNPFLFYFVLAPAFTYLGVYSLDAELPSLFTFAWQFVVCLLLEDTWFYWSHRLLHHPAIYKYAHKYHHEFKYNVGVNSEYAHPLEVLFTTIIAVHLGPALVKTHALSYYAWIVYRTAEGINGHCSYDFKWNPFNLIPFKSVSSRHEFHHSHNTGSYASQFVFWDWIMGTDTSYRVHQITSVTDKQRATFKAKQDAFSFDLADKQHFVLAQGLYEAVKKNAKVGDKWTNITLDNKAVTLDQLSELPKQGRLSLQHEVCGLRSQ